MNRASCLALALFLGVATGAAAQADTTGRDTTAVSVADTTPPDTASRLLPTFAPEIAPGPLPRGTRYTFTHDSLLFTSARTLSDVLAHVPGVFVVRGGWYGQAEIVLYGGRGPAALEVYWDGFPYLPLGRDSIWLDAARIPIGPLERIDVVVLPALLQVYLVTAKQRSTNPLTQIGILTGDQDIADYRAGYARRNRSGFGLSLLADWPSLSSTSTSSTTTDFSSSDLWLKADWIAPNGRRGASIQLLASSWHRKPLADGRVQGWEQQRRDRSLHFFIARRNDGLGLRLRGTLAASSVSHDTLVADRSVSGANLEISQTWRFANVTGIARFGGSGLPTQFEARAGWMPIKPLTIAGSVRHTSYNGDRTGDRAYLTAGLTLPLGFSARAQFGWLRDVQAPLDTGDNVQEATDVAGWLRFDHKLLFVEIGRGRRDPFAPIAFAGGIEPIDSLNTTPLTDFFAARASIRPLPGFELSGWFFQPVVGGADFEPPQHSRASLTFYSKFWRVFRSGIFALRVEYAVESWSRWGFAGIDDAGNPRTLGGATFAELNLQMQLGGATLFWVIRNANNMRGSYVEGLGYPKNAQMYGARWFFNN